MSSVVRAPAAPRAAPAYDVERIRADFPILGTRARGRPLIYLDNAASAQKPRAVLERMRDTYEAAYANVHRGVHYLSEQATERYEGARRTVQRFLNAGRAREIVFTGGGTEAINLVASSYARRLLQPGDEIVISGLEHHSNIVPWQLAAEERGLKLKAVPVEDDGSISLEAFGRLLTARTKLVAISHMSNVLGTVMPAKRIVEMAHAAGARVLFDGCQAVTHLPVDVRDLECDFYVFSGHKLYGPTGIGVLYGKAELLAAMPPYKGGGEMIRTVSLERSTYADPPARFEAGTPPFVQAIGLAAAIDYVDAVGKPAIAAHEGALVARAIERLGAVRGITLIGTAPGKAGVVSFTLEGAHPHDIATVLDGAGIAVRAGHHCAQPLMERFGVAATTRASVAMYTTTAEIDALADALENARRMLCP